MLHFARCQSRRTLAAVDHSQVLVELRPPGDAIRRWLHRYATKIGPDRGIDRRRNSAVVHRVDAPAEELVSAVAAELHSQPHYDAVEHEFRFPTRLHVPWSWPELPVWIGIAPLTPSRSIVRLSLRSHRRLRYPARYFHVAHSWLASLIG